MIYTELTTELHPLLDQFFKSKKNWPAWVLEYKTLDPDGCIWLLGEDFFEAESHKRHAIFMRDYISLGLSEVREEMAKFVGTFPHRVELLPVLKRQEFEKAGPVVAATVYQPPQDTNSFMEHAGTYDFYWVFCGEVR